MTTRFKSSGRALRRGNANIVVGKATGIVSFMRRVAKCPKRGASPRQHLFGAYINGKRFIP